MYILAFRILKGSSSCAFFLILLTEKSQCNLKTLGIDNVFCASENLNLKLALES